MNRPPPDSEKHDAPLFPFSNTEARAVERSSSATIFTQLVPSDLSTAVTASPAAIADAAFAEAYGNLVPKIPGKSTRGTGWLPFIDAWIRLRDLASELLKKEEQRRSVLLKQEKERRAARLTLLKQREERRELEEMHRGLGVPSSKTPSDDSPDVSIKEGMRVRTDAFGAEEFATVLQLNPDGSTADVNFDDRVVSDTMYLDQLTPIEPDGYPADWPRCPTCGAPALDGHITCGNASCGEAEHRDRRGSLSPENDQPSDIPPGWNNAKARAEEIGRELLVEPRVYIGDKFLLVQMPMSPPSVLTLSAAQRFRKDLDKMIRLLEAHLEAP